LSWWAEQGVLLLNTSLTVREGQSGSHAEVWEKFIGKFILLTNMFQRPIVFMLWGNKAKAFRQFIKDANYSRKVLTAVHPVAESRGSGQFVGCNHFKECNNFLEQYYGKNGSVDWRTYKNGEFPFPVEWQNFKLI
jgi:uracil-DNA glycosylase